MPIWDEISQDPLKMMILMQGMQELPRSLSRQYLPPSNMPGYAQGGGGYGGGGGSDGGLDMGSILRMQQLQAAQANQQADNELARQQFEMNQQKAAAEQQQAQERAAMVERAIPGLVDSTGQSADVVRAALLGGIDPNNPLLKAVGALAEPYTMSGGQVRFGPGNVPVAQVADKTELGSFLPLSGQQIDPGVVNAKSAVARAGRADQRTTVHLPPAETARETVIGKASGEDYNKIRRDAVDQQQQLADYENLTRILEGIDTGTGMDKLRVTAEKIGATFGLPVDAGQLAKKEYAQAVANEMTLKMMNAQATDMGAQISNSDRDFVAAIPPGIERTPEGRALATDMKRARASWAVGKARALDSFEARAGRRMTEYEQSEFDRAYAQDTPMYAGVAEKWAPKLQAGVAAPAPSADQTVQVPQPRAGGGAADVPAHLQKYFK